MHETLIAPSINVNLFSLQRVLKNGFLPVYDEVEGKCIIKKNIDGGGYSEVATMTVINGRATLDCKFLNNCDSNSGAMEALDLVEELLSTEPFYLLFVPLFPCCCLLRR